MKMGLETKNKIGHIQQQQNKTSTLFIRLKKMLKRNRRKMHC